MLLRFIGDTKTTGLKQGDVRRCVVETRDNFVWVRWQIEDAKIPPPIYAMYPYCSFKDMLESWEEI